LKALYNFELVVKLLPQFKVIDEVLSLVKTLLNCRTNSSLKNTIILKALYNFDLVVKLLPQFKVVDEVLTLV
jgi:hypothetical protein